MNISFIGVRKYFGCALQTATAFNAGHLEVVMFPTTSLRTVQKLTKVSRESDQKVMNEIESVFPYKMHMFQEIGDDLPDRRIQFYNDD